MKGNPGKTKVMANVGITMDGMSKSKVDPCAVCRLRVKVNSGLSVRCGKWIHSRCAGEKRENAKLSNFTYRKCERNVGEAA